MNTVQIFNSLSMSGGPYNDILLLAARIIIDSGIDLRVFHIPGESNGVADALSRGLLDIARQRRPDIRIHALKPPRLSLGDASC